MKFECGKRKRLKKAAKKKWHSYFAWYPIKVGFEDCRWLETIERRSVHVFRDMYFMGIPYRGECNQWEYRASGQ